MITPPATSPSPLSSAMPRRISGPDLHARDVAQRHRDSRARGQQGNLAKVVKRLQVSRHANHVLRLAQFEDRAAGLLIRLLHRLDDSLRVSR